MTELKILIVDDHNVVREGLKFILNQQANYQITVSEAFDSNSCMEIMSNSNFDLVLMDVNLGKESGVNLTRHILSKYANQKLIAITMHEEEYVIKQMMDAGAQGYLLKNTSGEELNLALETVLRGEIYCSYKVALNVLRGNKVSSKTTIEVQRAKLSKRELQVLKMIVEEMTNEEIAETLSLSKRTVDGHRQNMINKLGVRNTAGLVKFALEINL